MSAQIVLGSGLVGTRLAEQLAAAGAEVTVVSLSGRGRELAGVRRVAFDVATGDLREVEARPAAVFNCLNPTAYTRWAEEWPAIQRSTIEYASASGAPLVTASNLYPYGQVAGPMTPDLPAAPLGKKARIRAEMWAEVKALHDAGELRAAEVRASDYIAASEMSPLGERFTPVILRGKRPQVIGSPSVPHSWTAPADVARTMVAVAAAADALGRVWHVPTNPPRSMSEAGADIAKAAGVEFRGVSALPSPVLGLLAAFVPILREVKETEYQFQAPFVIEDHETRERFGLQPTPWQTLVAELVREYSGH